MAIIRILAGFLLLATSRPDEGQWLPQQFLDLDWDALRARGLTLTKDQFWHPTEGGVLSAAVQISGCSASFVSADGLVVTNHHCGFGAIQQNSTVERNLVRDGFAAAERKDELQAPGMAVFVVKGIDDVTARVHAAQAAAGGDLARFLAVEKEVAAIVAEAEKAEPDTKCHVASFLNGRHYHLYRRTRIQDVRLVYAPPRAVGEFGGEEDNWMWPRHTGDFCFFRAYVAPDGKPAPFSKENVPFKPKHWLRAAKQGVREGDLVMVLGYPGRTERYLSSIAVKSREEQTFPRRQRILRDIIAVLEKLGEGDPARKLELSPQVKSLWNSEKNARGMVAGLARNEMVSRKIGEEQAFSAWVKAESARAERYGKVLDAMKALDTDEAAQAAHDEVLNGFLRFAPLVSSLVQACYAAEEGAKPAAERESGYADAEIAAMRRRLAGPAAGKDFETLEKPLLAILFREALALPETQRLAPVDALCGEGTDGAELADLVASTTAMRDPAARKKLFEEGLDAVKASDDPLVRLARGLSSDLRQTRGRTRTIAGARLVTGNLWIEAQQAFRGATFYPDANSTLRVASGTVKGYVPRDGMNFLARTTLKGLVQKDTGVEPFNSPSALLDAAKSPDRGRFVDPELGDVPVCFLSDCDTTGGNSGSPMINGRGELVGLNFDRVFENVVGDYGWNAARSRNIGVDIRFILWNLEKVIPAPGLLTELGF